AAAGAGAAGRVAAGPARQRLRAAGGGRARGPARCARRGRLARAVVGAGRRRRPGRDVARVAAGFPGRSGVPVAPGTPVADLEVSGFGFFAASAAPTGARITGARGAVIRRREAVTCDGGDWGDLPPLLRRLHAARGATCLADAHPRLAQLHAPDALSGLADAVALLASAMEQGRRILVVGDFDCDGATACAVAVRGLRLLGAGNVLHAVPNRAVHGY